MTRYPLEMLDDYMRLQATTNDHQIRAIVSFAGRIDTDRLARAADAVLDAIPVARCAIVSDGNARRWEIRSFAGSDCVRVAESATGMPELERYLEETAPDSGPQILLRVLRGADRDVLILTINHILADGTGLKDILYALAGAYATGECAAFPQNRNLDVLLSRVGMARRVRSLLARPPKSVSTTLLAAGDGSSRARLFKIDIGHEEFAELRRKGKESGATVNDLVVAAMASALAEMRSDSGEKAGRKKAVTIQCMVDLRRYAPSHEVVGIGNFASMEPLTIKLAGSGAKAALTAVTKTTGPLKSRDPGLRNMLFLGFAHTRLPSGMFDRIITKVIEKKITVSTTNLGEIDGGRLRFGDIAIEDAFAITSLKREPSFQLTVSSFRGALRLTAFAKCSDGNARTIEDFLRRVERALRAELSA